MLNRFVIGLIVVILMGGTLFPLEPVQAQSSVNRQTQKQKPLTFGEKQTLQQHMNKALLNASNGWMYTLQQAGCMYNGATTYLKNPQCDPAMATDLNKKKDLEKIAKALFHEMGATTSGRCGEKNPAQVRFSDFVCSGIVPHTQKPSVAVLSSSNQIKKQVRDMHAERNTLNRSLERQLAKNGKELTFITKTTTTNTKLIDEFSPLCLDCFIFETVPVPNPIVYKRYHTTLTVPRQSNDLLFLHYVQKHMSNRLTEKEGNGTLVKLKKIMAQKCTIEKDSGICVYVYYDARNTTTLNNMIQGLKYSAFIAAVADVGVTTWKAVRAYKDTKCIHPDCAAFVISLGKFAIALGLTYLTTQEGYNIVERVFFKRT